MEQPPLNYEDRIKVKNAAICEEVYTKSEKSIDKGLINDVVSSVLEYMAAKISADKEFYIKNFGRFYIFDLVKNKKTEQRIKFKPDSIFKKMIQK